MREAGYYDARPVQAALGYTKNGAECVGVELEFLDNGQHMTWYGYFTEASTERTIESLRFCGWTGEDLSDLSEIGSQNVTVQATVEQDEYNGEVRAKVAWINRGGGLALSNPLDERQAKAFAARMKGSVMAYDQKKGAAPRQAQKAAPAAPATTQQPKQAPAPTGKVPDRPPF